MTFPEYTEAEIQEAKNNAFLFGVREEVSDNTAIAFLFWLSKQYSFPSHNKLQEYWEMECR